MCYIDIIPAMTAYSCELCPYVLLLLRIDDIIHRRNQKDQSHDDTFGPKSLPTWNAIITQIHCK